MALVHKYHKRTIHISDADLPYTRPSQFLFKIIPQNQIRLNGRLNSLSIQVTQHIEEISGLGYYSNDVVITLKSLFLTFPRLLVSQGPFVGGWKEIFFFSFFLYKILHEAENSSSGYERRMMIILTCQLNMV